MNFHFNVPINLFFGRGELNNLHKHLNSEKSFGGYFERKVCSKQRIFG